MPNQVLLFFLIPLGAVVWLPNMPSSVVLNTLLVVTLIGGLGVFLLKRYKCFRLIVSLLVLFVATSCGVLLGTLRIAHVIQNQLPAALELQDLEVVFEVASLPQQGELSTRFLASVHSIQCFPKAKEKSPKVCSGFAKWRGTIRLSWYGAPDLVVGQRWQANVRLRRPRGLVNTAGFDYQAWLLQQGIMASGYVRTKDGVSALESEPRGLIEFEKHRQDIASSFTAVAPSLNNHDLMRALAYGDKSFITTQRWALLNKSGTVHLMAISGLHIGLVATLGWWLGVGLLKLTCGVGRSTFLLMAAPYVLSILFAFFYAGLAGFAVPTLRALVMVVAVNIGFMSGKRFAGSRILIIAALFVLIIDPFAFMAAGFWLSFAAVACLFFCFSPRSSAVYVQESSLKAGLLRVISAVLALFKMQWQLFIGLFVLLLILGQQISWVSPLANFIAVPVVSILVVPLVLLASSLFNFWNAGAVQCLQLADLIMDAVLWWLNWVVSAQNTLPVFDVHLTFLDKIFALLATTLLLVPRILLLRGLGAVILLCVFFDKAKIENSFSVTVLDVGQGLSVLIQSPEANVLYDAGAAFSDDFDMGSRVVYPVLKSKAISTLDAVFVSHSDNDHAGGVGPLLNLMPVDRVVASRLEQKSTHKIVSAASSVQPVIEGCEAGDTWSFGNLTIKAIWPLGSNAVAPETIKLSSNNNSCVLLISYNNKNILLPGDIDKTVEGFLVESEAVPKAIDILVAAHHGSKTSSSQIFIDAVSIEHVVFSAGYKNRYYHPHSSVVDRFNRGLSKGFNTAVDGAVEFSLHAESPNWQINTARKAEKRMWFDE